MKSFIKVLTITIFITSNFAVAQSLEETLSHLSENAGVAYVEPIISAFGSNMSSGWVSGIPSASLFGLHLQVRLIAVGSFFNDDQKTFSTHGEFWYTSQQVDEILDASGVNPSNTPNYNQIKTEILSQSWSLDITGPTIIGSGDENVKILFPGAEIQGVTIASVLTTLTGVNGFLDGLSIFPSPAVQLDVGNVAGTKLSIRYFPKVEISDLGKIGLWGFGVLHNPGFWLSDPLPVNIGLGFFFQKLELGSVFVNKSLMFGIYAGKSFGMIVSFEPYLGLTYETSTTKMRYTYMFNTPLGPQTQNISVDLDGDNTVGLTIGASLNLPVISLNIDYKIAKIKTLTAGLNIGF